ncbi:hypothetical protein [Alistipes sp. UBA6068]|uniref:hypothetical protein n=1 Tax=Alistipes sp. UBA6068 TaxID=1946012 RepID=UPI002595FA19|nr:hypothetical protein [Alistipes sp. UBA6068]
MAREGTKEKEQSKRTKEKKKDEMTRAGQNEKGGTSRTKEKRRTESENTFHERPFTFHRRKKIPLRNGCAEDSYEREAIIGIFRGNVDYFSYFCINWKIVNLNAEVP